MPRILVADDDPVQLELRKMLLEAAGHEVLPAYSAMQVMRHLRERGADVVLLDLRFPNAQGEPDSREGLALIRKVHETCASAPIVLLSGWTEDIDGHPEEKLVRRILLKPVKPSLLVETIREVLP
jgi:CheY-like chemotaxis protein